MISTEFPHLPRPIVPAINCDGKVLSFQISEFFAKNCLFHRREKVLEFLRSTCSAPRPAGPDLGALHSPATRRLVQVVDFQLGVGVYKFIVAQAVFECGQASSHRLRPARAPPAGLACRCYSTRLVAWPWPAPLAASGGCGGAAKRSRRDPLFPFSIFIAPALWSIENGRGSRRLRLGALDLAVRRPCLRAGRALCGRVAHLRGGTLPASRRQGGAARARRLPYRAGSCWH